MAKCIGSVNKWTPRCAVIANPEFLSTDIRLGEDLLKERMESLEALILDIVHHYLMIKQSALSGEGGFKIDCHQVQDGLIKKLELLLEETTSVIACISSSSLTSVAKQRYYIQYTYGFIEKADQLVQMIGRLSEIDMRLYLEEQRKPLISDESITLHSIVSIWTAILEILNGFCRSASPVFNSNPITPDDQDLLGELEFSSARVRFARALLMDFIITSWIQYNRLIKYEDLVRGKPFLCPCHMTAFFNTLPLSSKEKLDKHDDDQLEKHLHDMWQSILDYKSRPSMMTMSARRFGIIPMEPSYVTANQSELAYFLIWHLYSLTSKGSMKFTEELASSSQTIIEKSFKIVSETFLPKGSQIKRLSPHQEERFKLIFLMISSWLETFKGNVKLLSQMLEFAASIHKEVKEADYMENSGFTVNGLTLYHLFSKLFNEAIPEYETRQADAQESTSTQDEQDLIAIWNAMLDQHVKSSKSAQTAPPVK